MTTSPISHSPLHNAVRSLYRFGIVGLVAFAIDIGLFIALTASSMFGDGWGPVDAKVLSTAVAAVVGFVGNYSWVFAGAEAVLSWATVRRFIITNIAALSYSVLPMVVLHDILEVRSLLLTNVVANLVGVAIGSAVRFLSYKHWVFPTASLAGDPA